MPTDPKQYKHLILDWVATQVSTDVYETEMWGKFIFLPAELIETSSDRELMEKQDRIFDSRQDYINATKQDYYTFRAIILAHKE